MAFERAQNSVILGDSLDSFVSGISQMYSNQLATRNAALELNFNTQVLQGNLSLEDQLSFRKAQLDEVSDDPAEKQRIQGQINNLTDMIEQKNFTASYTDQVTKYAAGTESIDSVISWLQTTLATTTDPTIQQKIQSELETQQQTKFTLTQQMLKDQTNYALNNNTANVINTQVSALQTAKASALIAGDSAVAASLDLQIQSLQQSLAQNSIQTDILNMGVSTSSGYSNAQSLLNMYGQKISSADTSVPVTIGGVTFSSAQAYWQYAQGKYLSDQSSSGFFARIDNEMTTAIKVANSNNTLSTANLQSAASTYQNLANNPLLAPYAAQLAAAQADTLQTAADFISTKIVNTFDNNLDLSSAVQSLNSLKAMGVNVDAAYQDIIKSAAATQSTSLQNIIQNAQTLMSSTPGLSISDAVTQAISKGSGIILSPNDLTGRTPGSLATSILGQTTTGTTPADNRTTMPGGTPGTTPGTPGAPAAGGGSYTIQNGDTLSALAARFGTTVQALMAANGITDPNMIRAGAQLILPGGTAAGGATTSAPVTTTTPPATSSYTGGSIVDYLSSIGQASDFSTRATLAANHGITGYTGTAAQNTQLLNALKSTPVTATSTPATGTGGGSTPAPAASVNNSTSTYSAGDTGSAISYYRSLIQNGQMSPSDAFSHLQAILPKPDYTSATAIQQYTASIASAKSSLYSNLGTIKTTDGQYGTVNGDGSVTQTSTKIVNSNTSAGGSGTSSSTSAVMPAGQSAPTIAPVTGNAPVAPTPAYQAPVNNTPAPAANPAPAPVTTPAPAPTIRPVTSSNSGYSGVSVVDYLASVGRATDYNSRATLAASHGITNYSGTADQNTQLLRTLRGY